MGRPWGFGGEAPEKPAAGDVPVLWSEVQHAFGCSFRYTIRMYVLAMRDDEDLRFTSLKAALDSATSDMDTQRILARAGEFYTYLKGNGDGSEQG